MKIVISKGECQTFIDFNYEKFVWDGSNYQGLLETEFDGQPVKVFLMLNYDFVKDDIDYERWYAEVMDFNSGRELDGFTLKLLPE